MILELSGPNHSTNGVLRMRNRFESSTLMPWAANRSMFLGASRIMHPNQSSIGFLNSFLLRLLQPVNDNLSPSKEVRELISLIARLSQMIVRAQVLHVRRACACCAIYENKHEFFFERSSTKKGQLKFNINGYIYVFYHKYHLFYVITRDYFKGQQ